MKKQFALFFILLSLITVCCIEVVAEASSQERERYTSGDYDYVVLEDGTAEIVHYSGFANALIIPDILSGRIVTSIGEMAFSCDSLISITIPDSVNNIEGNPFAWCYNLTDIVVSSDHPYLITINGVLYSKTDLRLVCYPHAFTADSYVIPKGTRIVGESAFYGCGALISVTIPDSVTVIGESAFTLCESLAHVIIPDKVTRIEAGTFCDCSSLASITIPNSVTSIGRWAFTNCSSLASVTIPNSVTSIGENAFRYCSSLASVTIPNSVTSIGENAFTYCSSLTSVTIPNSVTSIAGNPLACCYKLTDIIVSPDHPYLITLNGVLFNKSDRRLVCYPCALAADS